MSGKITPKLDYQFVCHYEDGTKLHQNVDKKDEKHFGHIDQKKLERFELVGKGKSYSVDVKTGEFNLNGTRIYFDELPVQEEFKLIYFRRVQVKLRPGRMEMLEGVPYPDQYSLRYCFGLQCTYKGKNRQVLLWIESDDSLTINNKK